MRISFTSVLNSYFFLNYYSCILLSLEFKKMIEFCNHIQYVVPGNSEICFSISPETRDVSLILMNGAADIYVKNKRIPLPLKQEFSIQFWECLCPRLKTKFGCDFLVRGNHYVSSAIQRGHVEKQLFAVSPMENSYSFVLEKGIQLHVFSVKSTEQETCVTVRNSRGAPDTSGFKLNPERTYDLPRFSPLLLKSSDDKPYSVCIQGYDRKVKLSIRDENHHKCANDVKDRIFEFVKQKFKHITPTILVLGTKHVGKTSFCQLLVNEALEKKMTPIYVDLNVKRNLSVPGSLSLCEIESRIDCTLDFNYNILKLLHYGSLVFHAVSLRFYYFLVQKMGTLLSFQLNYNSKGKSLSLIDTDGSHGENDPAIEHFLMSFAVDFVVYIGDGYYYENLKSSILKNVRSEFIPKPRNAEQPNDSYEARYYQHRIQKYFFGSTDPSIRNTRKVALRNIILYRISTLTSDTSTRGENADYKIERINFNMRLNPSLINRLFGVSGAKRPDIQGLPEIKYYVYFTDIDMSTATVTVVIPDSEDFNGGILLMSHVLRLEDSEIE